MDTISFSKIAKLIIKEHAAALRRGYTGRPTFGSFLLTEDARARISTVIRQDMEGYTRYKNILDVPIGGIKADEWQFINEFEERSRRALLEAERDTAKWAATVLEQRAIEDLSV